MQDILQDVHQYSHQLTISKVIIFFERKGVVLTRSMIQNYVRDGLLKPPLNKRYYTHKHLAALTLIIALKTVYEMNHIKAVLTPLMDEEGISLELYRECIQRAASLSLHDDLDALSLMTYSVDLKNEAMRRFD